MKYNLILLISLLFFILGCGGTGAMNEENEDDDQYFVYETDVCQGEPAFTYEYRVENPVEPFHAYGKTQFRLIHNGPCDYNFNLLVNSTQQQYEMLTQGFGTLNILKVYDLPDDNYILEVNTDEGCGWVVEIESLQQVGCDEKQI